MFLGCLRHITKWILLFWGEKFTLVIYLVYDNFRAWVKSGRFGRLPLLFHVKNSILFKRIANCSPSSNQPQNPDSVNNQWDFFS